MTDKENESTALSCICHKVLGNVTESKRNTLFLFIYFLSVCVESCLLLLMTCEYVGNIAHSCDIGGGDE